MADKIGDKNGVDYAIAIARQIRLGDCKAWNYREGYINFKIGDESKKYKAIYQQYLLIKNALIIWAKEEDFRKRKKE